MTKELTKAELYTLKEAVLTWLTLIANDTGECGTEEALDITLQSGEILGIEKDYMEDILDRG